MTYPTPTGGSDAAPANDGPLSVRDAAALLSERRDDGAPETSPPPDRDAHRRVARAEADTLFAPDGADAAAADAQPPGATEADDAAPEAPPVAPPRSWTKEDQDWFRDLPRATQERIAERERSRESEVRRRQDEIAEHRKAAEAERAQALHARQAYEQALAHTLQSLNGQQAQEFADVKSEADLAKMADEDPLRYVKWQALQTQRQAAWQRWREAELRKVQEHTHQFTAFAQDQDRLASERTPDLADAEKGAKLRESTARHVVEHLGFTPEEIARLWKGHDTISLRDARLQTALINSARWEAAQKAARDAAAKPKPLPPVQRPGVAPGPGHARRAELETLSQKLDRATSSSEAVKAAAALLSARRQDRRA